MLPWLEKKSESSCDTCFVSHAGNPAFKRQQALQRLRLDT